MRDAINILNFSEFRSEIENHGALIELATFGRNLASRPLTLEERKIYFATMWAFFKEIPTGILALALHVSDDWLTRDQWNGTAMGAHILFADVDEFGLQTIHKKFQPTHHHLFHDLVNFLGVEDGDFSDPRYVLGAGRQMGEITRKYYREEPIQTGLGFHMASELTSSIEFRYFLDGFKKHKEAYAIKADNDPVLTFFRIHTLVEPMHLAQSEEIINRYLEIDPSALDLIENGAIAFMKGFEHLFAALNKRIYGAG
jgi:hypothetical protein